MALPTKAAQPILHVRGIARLAHLAVVDEIDARVHLTPHHLGDRGAYARVERRRVHRHTLFLGVHGADEIGGTRQAPGVRREEPLHAAREWHRPAQAARAEAPSQDGFVSGLTGKPKLTRSVGLMRHSVL